MVSRLYDVCLGKKSFVDDQSADMTTVSPNQGRAIVQVKDGLFCCGFFNSSSGTCLNSTRGSDAPFSVDQGSVILNRWSGLTSPNDSATVVSAATPVGATVNSVTVMATAAARTAASLPPTSDRAATVGAAVGVPLGLALLGFVAMLWRQKREAAALRKQKEEWEEKYITLLQSKLETQRSGNNVPHTLSERETCHELEEATIGELAS